MLLDNPPLSYVKTLIDLDINRKGSKLISPYLSMARQADDQVEIDVKPEWTVSSSISLIERSASPNGSTFTITTIGLTSEADARRSQKSRRRSRRKLVSHQFNNV
jgi:hypothetical protein